MLFRSLRPQCTDTKQGRRVLTVRPSFERGRAAMLARMQAPDAKARYAQRMATIEPVFANIQSVLGFRRLSSRHTPTVRAEIVLKLLAHNISRLLARRPQLFLFFVVLTEF